MSVFVHVVVECPLTKRIKLRHIIFCLLSFTQMRTILFYFPNGTQYVPVFTSLNDIATQKVLWRSDKKVANASNFLKKS